MTVFGNMYNSTQRDVQYGVAEMCQAFWRLVTFGILYGLIFVL